MRECIAVSLGVMDYLAAWKLQQSLVDLRASGAVPDLLLLVEHPHVYTLGRRAEDIEVLLSPAELKEAGATVYHVDRGGLATYHGPGQLVGYPILHLRELGYGPVRYVRAMEQILVQTAGRLGVTAACQEGLTGVWVGDRKLAAIGVRVSRGVASHGFALNVNTDLSYFEHVIPCGMPDVHATSLARELGKPVDMPRVRDVVAQEVGKAFGFAMRQGDVHALTSGALRG